MDIPVSAASLIELGRLDPPARPIPGDGPRGRLYYLASLDAVIAPQCRLADGWWCRVVACRGPDHSPARLGDLRVCDADLADAATVIVLAPHDADGLAMLWRVKVVQRWRGGHMVALARLLASPQVRTGTVVTITDPIARRLMLGVHLWAAGLGSLLRQLVHTGFLTPIEPCPDDTWGVYVITIPTPTTDLDRQTP
jgi:hypothetical protein